MFYGCKEIEIETKNLGFFISKLRINSVQGTTLIYKTELNPKDIYKYFYNMFSGKITIAHKIPINEDIEKFSIGCESYGTTLNISIYNINSYNTNKYIDSDEETFCNNGTSTDNPIIKRDREHNIIETNF